MLVFAPARLVLLSVPKTGTTALEQALAPLASMAVNAPPELKHSPVFRYNRYFRPMLERFIDDKLDVVAVMRDPLDWLGSWYRFRARPEMEGHQNSTAQISFDQFVQGYLKGDKPSYANVGSQAKFLEPQRNGTAITHLFRYEEPDRLRSFLEKRLNTQIKTERINSSPPRDMDLTAKTADRFRRKCAHEYELWSSIRDGGKFTPLPTE